MTDTADALSPLDEAGVSALVEEALAAIAGAADADRDMAALTLAVGASGMKRLRAAWALADSLSDRARPLPSSPVEAARALVPAAVEAARTLTAVKTLLD